MSPIRYDGKMSQKPNSFVPIFVTVFLDMVGFGIVIPILAPLFLNLQDGLLPHNYSLEYRTALLGFLIAAYPIAQFFGAPILGAWSDRVGRKKIIILSLAGTLVGYVLFAIGVLTNNLVLLFGSRALDGFTGGNISTAMSAIADISDKHTKARNFGLVGMAFGLGFILGPYIGGKLADPHVLSWFSFDTPFWFAASLTAANIALVYLKFQETLHTKINTKISLLTGMHNIRKAFWFQNLRVMFLVIFMLTFGFTFFTQFFQVYLIDKFHYTQSQIGDVFAYAGLWIAITQGIITRFVSKKYAPEHIVRATALGLAIALPLLIIPTKTLWLLAALPFVAIFQGLTQPNATAIISNLSAEDSQGEVLGIQQSIQSVATAIPPIIAGFIFSINRNLPTLVAGACTLIAWFIFVALYNPRKKELFHEVS